MFVELFFCVCMFCLFEVINLVFVYCCCCCCFCMGLCCFLVCEFGWLFIFVVDWMFVGFWLLWFLLLILSSMFGSFWRWIFVSCFLYFFDCEFFFFLLWRRSFELVVVVFVVLILRMKFFKVVVFSGKNVVLIICNLEYVRVFVN